ncbi:unnamed protein product [Rhizophagus irregularis]|nr:unnamed protein product [Rhizophagus irregularis]
MILFSIRQIDVVAILIERGYNVTLLSAGRYEPSSEYPGLNQITLGLSEKTAKEYNIDLFICDVLANEACIDAANNLKKPVVGWTSFLQFMDPVPYKDDPVYGCNTSLENESFFERFRCALIQPLQVASKLGPFAHQLNDIRKQMNIEPSGKIPKVSLSLVDTFFGFELPQHLAPNVQEVGPVLPEEYPPITPELSNFMNAHERQSTKK